MNYINLLDTRALHCIALLDTTALHFIVLLDTTAIPAKKYLFRKQSFEEEIFEKMG